MRIMNLMAGEPLAKKQDKVTEWYLIQSGAIVQSFGHAQIVLERVFDSCSLFLIEQKSLQAA